MRHADSPSFDVVVVGGGLAGLASACVAAARGHRVTLLEKNEWLGGKAAVHRGDGYRFDMGPTILTLPEVLARVFAEAGRKLEDILQLTPLDPQWRCFFENSPRADGHRASGREVAGDPPRVLDLTADTAAMKQRLREFTGDDHTGEGYERFLKLSEQLHRVSERFFFWRSVGGLRDTMDVAGSLRASVLKDVLSLRMGRSVASVVRTHVPDHHVAQMMDHFTQYVGSSPYASPAVLCGIAHMQTRGGVWYPVGGTRAVVEALERLAGELGVQLRPGVDVERVLVASGRAAGVLTSTGERIPCDAVISNSDAVRTYRELLSGTSAAKRFSRKQGREPACSGVVLYLGLNRRYEQLLHHNFVFSRDAKEEFDWIYRRGQPAPDPTAYVCAPAASDPAVAPAGGEALYVLVHTPYLRPGHDWKTLFPEYRDVILDKLERAAGMTGLREAIRYETALTPEDIHQRYRVLDGAIYGLASHGKFLGAFKPGNRRSDLPGLYLAGGSAHPGPGMPMVLMSGWIAADALDRDAQNAPRRRGERAGAVPGR